MNPTIEKIVNLLFEDLEENEEVRALHDEVMLNCQERFSDLTESGMSADEATGAVVESLKGMEEMLREYPRKASNETAEEDVGRSYTFSPEGIRTIEAQLASENITCTFSPDGLVHVEADNCVRVSLLDGRLHIAHVERPHVGASFKISFFNFNFSFSSEDVKLLLPDSFIADVQLRTASGDVEWRGLSANRLSIATASGDVTVSDAQIHGEAQVQTASGDVEILTSSMKRMDVTTASGDVHCNAPCPDAQVSSISGDITIKGDCARIQCKTTSGDARIEAENCLERISGQSTSGDARIRLPVGMQALLNCRSRFGDVRQRVSSFPNPDVTVEWSATSGDITIE